MSEGITFSATLVGVRMMTDGGWRVTIDVPENETPAVHELSKLRGCVLGVAVVQEDIG